MERVRDGDAQAFETLLNRYWQRLLTYGASVTGDQDSAEDVVQESFLRVWRNRESWEPSGSVGAYLYRITRNLALNRDRDERSRQERKRRAHGGSMSRKRVTTPEDDLQAAEVVQEVREAISTLPERRREIFTLSRFHQLTHAEIADAMDISVQTVANQMTAALADLRKVLAHLLVQD